jgi:hypothetical protein
MAPSTKAISKSFRELFDFSVLKYLKFINFFHSKYLSFINSIKTMVLSSQHVKENHPTFNFITIYSI